MFKYRPDGLRRIDSDELDPFGHRDYAAAVVSVLASLPTHFTLGLFGPWGSGKSTILEEVRRRITDDEADVKSGFVLFDAWRYEGDSLRREFLKASARSLHKAKVLDAKVVEDLDESLDVDKTVPEQPALRLLDPDLFKRAGLAALAVMATIGVAILGLPYLGLEQGTILSFLLAISGALTAFGLVALQPVISPATIQKTKRRPEYPDEFSASFRQLLDKVKVERLVIAIDNLDRCSPARVTQTLATIKTFLEPAFEEGEELGVQRDLKQLCFIVAADDVALRRHLTAQELSESVLMRDNNHGDSRGAPEPIHGSHELPPEVRDSVEEYLRKFFGASVRIREVLDEDITRFCETEFEAFFDARTEIDETTKRDLIEMTSQALKRNPRRVVQFVNNLALRLEVLGKRRSERRIQIEPEALVVAKLAIIEEEFPDHYNALQREPLLLERWQIHAREASERLEDNPRDDRVQKTEQERLDDFLRFTDHIRSRHLRAYLDLKQTSDEVTLERHSELVDSLDGGDTGAVRTLLTEVDNQEAQYIQAVERHFERQAHRGNWGAAHNTLRVVVEIPALHGRDGMIAKRLLDESLSHPGLTRLLPQLPARRLLDAADMYLTKGKFNQLVGALSSGIRQPSDAEMRRDIAAAIAAHKDSLSTATVERLASILRSEEVKHDFPSYVELVEAVPAVAAQALATSSIERLEELAAEEISGDGPELRVAVVAVGRTLQPAEFAKLIEIGRAKLEASRERDDDYGWVVFRLTQLVRLASENPKSRDADGKPELPGRDARRQLVVAIADNWEATPERARWESLLLGYELCRLDSEDDTERGYELGSRIFSHEAVPDVGSWVEQNLTQMPTRFAEAVREELANALAGARKMFPPEQAETLVERLPPEIADAVRRRALNLAISEDREARASALLDNVDSETAQTIVAEIADNLEAGPGEIEARSGEVNFFVAQQERLEAARLFAFATSLSEAANSQRGISIPLGDVIARLRLDDAQQRLEVVQRLLDIEADMGDAARRAAMLRAAIGVAGKRSSNARQAALGRLRERLGAADADVARSARELLQAESELGESE
jgi:hypothetical protein